MWLRLFCGRCVISLSRGSVLPYLRFLRSVSTIFTSFLTFCVEIMTADWRLRILRELVLRWGLVYIAVGGNSYTKSDFVCIRAHASKRVHE